jgi:LysM repeat protein
MGDFSDFITYRIKRGDTLTRLAKVYQTTVERIVEDNNIINPDVIIAGRDLRIRSASGVRPDIPVVGLNVGENDFSYIVQAGDTLSQLAGRFGVSVDQIAVTNYIKNIHLIYVGQVLKIRRVGNTADKWVKPSEAMPKSEVEKIIREIAERKGVLPDLAVKVARCESGLNQFAVNVNKNGTKDRGVFQWNDYWHPSINDEMAFNVHKATELFCDAVLAGRLSWWSASEKCWSR